MSEQPPVKALLAGKRLAILGIGMMGGALAKGFVRSGAIDAKDLILYDLHTAQAHRVADDLGASSTSGTKPVVAPTPSEAAALANVIVIAVKPPIVPGLLESVSSSVVSSQLVVSIAAGVRLEAMEQILSDQVPIIRVMPNTPALVGEGATALARGQHASHEHLLQAQHLFESVGVCVVVDEALMDAVTGLSGSGPAYVYLLIESLMDGGVKAGLTRETSRLLAAQTVYGAAKMVLESSQHPAELRDDVTTPGGTTIAALAVLERAGMRIALMDAIEAAAARSKELSNRTA